MKQFWLEALERAIKTAAQTAIAAFGTDKLVTTIDLKVMLAMVGTATLLSVLTSLASINIGKKDSASIVKK